MPLKHILMYRFYARVPESRIDEHLAFIESLRDRFPGLLDLRCGRDPDFGVSVAHRFTHGFVMTFASPEALEDYGKSALHGELVRSFRDDVEDKIVFDFGYTP